MLIRVLISLGEAREAGGAAASALGALPEVDEYSQLATGRLPCIFRVPLPLTHEADALACCDGGGSSGGGGGGLDGGVGVPSCW